MDIRTLITNTTTTFRRSAFWKILVFQLHQHLTTGSTIPRVVHPPLPLLLYALARPGAPGAVVGALGALGAPGAAVGVLGALGAPAAVVGALGVPAAPAAVVGALGAPAAVVGALEAITPHLALATTNPAKQLEAMRPCTMRTLRPVAAVR